jgi:hypothetical protein
MIQQPIPLTPKDVSVLVDCPLHYHFLQQKSALPASFSTETELYALVQATIQHLHAAGGPARVLLENCLDQVGDYPPARRMVENYYQRLTQDWPRMMAGNERMELRISIGGVLLALSGTVDRLDKTSDGGILAILFRTGEGSPPTAANLRRDPALTIYHALVASTYPLKRPVRLQQLWLQLNQDITVELSEDEYRHNLGRLREPVQALARGEVMARPGLHCDVCSFKYRGCPVYAHNADTETENDDFAPSASGGKIPSRKWIFKV